jgi:hypothetical protein
MSQELERRIDALDGKQAIHYLTLISNGTPPTTEYSLQEIQREAEKAEVDVPPDLTDNPDKVALKGPEGYPLAKSMLKALAGSPGGEPIVQAALEKEQSQTGDFGLLSGPAILLAWMAITSEIDITIGGVRIHKKGLSSADQVSLAKNLLPAVLKAFLGAQ